MISTGWRKSTRSAQHSDRKENCCCGNFALGAAYASASIAAISCRLLLIFSHSTAIRKSSARYSSNVAVSAVCITRNASRLHVSAQALNSACRSDIRHPSDLGGFAKRQILQNFSEIHTAAVH